MVIGERSRIRTCFVTCENLSFRSTDGIITSANLTDGGLRNNLEYGILFDDTQLVQQVTNELDCLYQDSLTDKLTRNKVNELVRLQQVLKQAFHQNDIKEHPTTYTSLTEETITNQLKGWKKDLFEVVNYKQPNFNCRKSTDIRIVYS
ncbi:hypothetical protein [Enterococcus italicus]|uniref:hypothetical protein n=1 Tax=Enterococcus italicus TaxID=246144 RepID=UPI0028AC0F11|nr:hypothetical protein [Enterococcus italicus]